MPPGVQPIGDAWLLVAHYVSREVLRDPSVFQQGHHGLPDRVEDLLLGEPQGCLQSPEAFTDGIGAVTVLVEGQTGQQVAILACTHQAIHDLDQCRMNRHMPDPGIRLAVGDGEDFLGAVLDLQRT